ncbi:enoyl-CoA-hydratase DpgB [Streptomyces shenzhenensis]|uniref:enoyl-CoA-hydratase DpgB n=1 Tax=Streptomyces shenzhenensis TaxID=943815 RepID=UPI001F27F493|nr:enoyl-CoA-hydratase DpgB [Streptomyces shenzhenensis]
MESVNEPAALLLRRLENDSTLLRIDGTRPLSAESVAAVGAVCDRAEDPGGPDSVIVQVCGVPDRTWADNLTISLVSKWERALRRLERLPASTIAVVDGACGGQALDVLLATDYRIATGSARLVVPAAGGDSWPGMALYRLVQYGGNATAVRNAVFFGTPVEAADALALNLVDELVDDLDGALAAAAGRGGAVSGAELAIRRQLMLDASTTSFEEALGAHLAACDRALRRSAAGAVS